VDEAVAVSRRVVSGDLDAMNWPRRADVGHLQQRLRYAEGLEKQLSEVQADC